MNANGRLDGADRYYNMAGYDQGTKIFMLDNGVGFARKEHAQASALDIYGDRDEYSEVSYYDVGTWGTLDSAPTPADVDEILATRDLTPVISQFAAEKRAYLVEYDRQIAAVAFVATLAGPDALTILNMLLHNEENDEIISAINTRIGEL